MSSVKYRPYLTRHQMEYILMKIAECADPEAIQIRVSFNKILTLADVGLYKGSYVEKPRPTLEQKMGFLSEELTEEQEAELLKQIGSPQSK